MSQPPASCGVVPVLDVQHGRVVHGRGGRRENYRELECVWGCGSRPAAVARAIVRNLGLSTAYLADLDALGGAEPAWHVYRAVQDEGLNLWVDAGPTSVAAARRLAEFRCGGRALAGLVAGVESLRDAAAACELAEAVGPARFVFSLDLFQGQLWTSAPGWQGRGGEDVVRELAARGVRRVIVLDVASVGSNGGIATLELCRGIAARWPEVELTVGGGVRGRDDLLQAAAAGCRQALVASALYDGRLDRAAVGGEW